MPEKKWVKHFARELGGSQQNKEVFFEKPLDLVLSNKTKSLLVLSPSAVPLFDSEIKGKTSSGVDSISARHLQLAGSLIEQHLALLFQMILVCGVVPLQFCIIVSS